jgi:hypothetical protein
MWFKCFKALIFPLEPRPMLYYEKMLCTVYCNPGNTGTEPGTTSLPGLEATVLSPNFKTLNFNFLTFNFLKKAQDTPYCLFLLMLLLWDIVHTMQLAKPILCCNLIMSS